MRIGIVIGCGAGDRLDITRRLPTLGQVLLVVLLSTVEGLGRFDLAEVPDSRTVQVWVDGVAWTGGWHIEGQTLVFDETPPEGSKIRTTYHNLACQ